MGLRPAKLSISQNLWAPRGQKANSIVIYKVAWWKIQIKITLKIFCPLELVYRWKFKLNERTLGLWARILQPERSTMLTMISVILSGSLTIDFKNSVETIRDKRYGGKKYWVYNWTSFPWTRHKYQAFSTFSSSEIPMRIQKWRKKIEWRSKLHLAGTRWTRWKQRWDSIAHWRKMTNGWQHCFYWSFRK